MLSSFTTNAWHLTLLKDPAKNHPTPNTPATSVAGDASAKASDAKVIAVKDDTNVVVRSNSLKDLLAREFEEEKKRTVAYRWLGSPTYDYYNVSDRLMGGLYSDVIIDAFLKKKNNLTVCDIGAGDFSFSRHLREKSSKIKAYGITAHRFTDDKPSDEDVIGNAENLSEIFGRDRFDCTFSRNTYQWLREPAGALVENYRTLKVGGILMQCANIFFFH